MTIPAPLLRLFAQTFRRYREAGLTVSQAIAEARKDVIDGR